MSLFVSDAGLINNLVQITAQTFWIHLFKNAFVPGPHFNPALLTESTFSGYQPAQCQNWTTPTIDGQGHAVTNADLVHFTATGLTAGENAYGYYLTLGQTGPVYAAEAFPLGPLDVSSSGKQVFIVPNLCNSTPC